MSTPRRSVWSFPRPPALNPISKRLRVVASDGTVLADSTSGYEVLETSHPPTYYLPPEDCNMDALRENSRGSMCEWKGRASYYDATVDGRKIVSRIWTYHRPSATFKPIKDYLAFYASPWKCYVDEEEVQAQDGDFYGGDDPSGRRSGIKGAPGTLHW